MKLKGISKWNEETFINASTDVFLMVTTNDNYMVYKSVEVNDGDFKSIALSLNNKRSYTTSNLHELYELIIYDFNEHILQIIDDSKLKIVVE